MQKTLVLTFLFLTTSRSRCSSIPSEENKDGGNNNNNKPSSEIIGSSVVTSVSVILGGENDDLLRSPEGMRRDLSFPQPVILTIDTAGSVPVPPPTVVVSSSPSDDEEDENARYFPEHREQVRRSQLIIKNKRQEEQAQQGVASVINTLKNIVAEKQAEHTVTISSVETGDKPSVVKKGGPKFGSGEGDDDEMESSNDAQAGGSTTDAIHEFAKHVVSISSVPEETENDTASSAEVHDAIHKISGAILSVEDGDKAKVTKPDIENIVNDVLTSINSARNATQGQAAIFQPALSLGSGPQVTGALQYQTKSDLQAIIQNTSTESTSSTSSTTTTTTPAPPPSTTAKPPTTKRPATTTKPKTTKRPTTTKPKTTKKTTPKVATTSRRTTTKATTTTTTTTTQAPTTTATTVEPPPTQEDEESAEVSENSAKDDRDMVEEQKPEPKPTSRPQKIVLPSIIMLESDHKPMVKKKPMVVVSASSPSDDRIPGIPIDDTNAAAEEEDNANAWQVPPGYDLPPGLMINPLQEEAEAEVASQATLRPYSPPPKKTPVVHRRPSNESSSSTRPNEFYDDEIFGYDPYQTFFHGVYVPVVEVATLQEVQTHQDQSESSSEEYEEVRTTTTPKPRRKKPIKPHKRPHPMPALPDHLHRPRPSHLQYQHGAADDTDPETGLLNAHFEHAGHSYGPDGEVLATHSRPSLPAQVRKNFTEYHDSHVAHQHGLGGGHGHGHGHHGDHLHQHLADTAAAEKRPNFTPSPTGNPGLEATLTSLDPEKRLFVDINNRLALRLLSSLTNPVSHSSASYGNMVISPFTIISSLGMLFLGARGQTAAQIDGLLQLDDMLTFNPHMLYHNVTESFLSQPNTAAAVIRLLVTDKDRADVLDFYKTRVQQFYEARVEEVDYKFAGHLAQSIINQMIRAQIQRHSYEMVNGSLPLAGPMSLITSMFFDGQFAGGRDPSVDHMNFIHLAALNQGPTGRRLFQVPALALRGHFRAAFDKDLDATAVELPYTSRDLSLILVMPGKPGEFAFGGVTTLKPRLNLEAWTKLMRGFYPRDPFKVVLPRFRHQSSVNLSHTLGRLGLGDMFDPTMAKFKGVNGQSDLALDKNMLHFAEFGTWEKLSDTLNEPQNRNLDLIRILRPHVRDHYGNFGEPMTVNEWIFKSREQQQNGQQRSQSENNMNVPDDVSRLRLELERLKRRQPIQDLHHHPLPPTEREVPLQGDNYWNPQSANSLPSYARVRGTTVEFRPRKLKDGMRTHRSKVYYFRQEETAPTSAEQETVLRFERPFLYFLRHNPTGMILMAGQYTEPMTEVVE